MLELIADYVAVGNEIDWCVHYWFLGETMNLLQATFGDHFLNAFYFDSNLTEVWSYKPIAITSTLVQANAMQQTDAKAIV